jgi:hypothetical protein
VVPQEATQEHLNLLAALARLFSQDEFCTALRDCRTSEALYNTAINWAKRSAEWTLSIISGRSGSGKSTALHQLEDEGYFAIDNLPPSLLPALVQESGPGLARHFRGIATCIDARNAWRDLEQFPAILGALPDSVQRRVLYLDADEATLMRRFSETRRRHPLSSESLPLAEAIRREQELLEPLAASASLTLDTRAMTIYELRDAIRQRVVGAGRRGADRAGAVLRFQARHTRRRGPGLRPAYAAQPALVRRPARAERP